MTEKVGAPVNTPALVGLHTYGALVIAGVWTLTESVRAIVTGAASRAPAWWVLSIVALTVCSVMLLRPTTDPLPMRTTLLVAGLPTLGAFTNIAMLESPSSFGLYDMWTWPVGTIILCFLVLRGRALMAWAGQLLLSGTVLSWWWLTGPVESQVTDSGQEFSWNLSFLAVCTVLGVAMRRQVTIINELRDTTASVEIHRELAAARTAERDRELVYLNATARPLLERIVDSDSLSDADRIEISLVEAQLRDRIRARGLVRGPLVDAVREARLRGVTVVLLDDGGVDALPESHRELTRQRMTALLLRELEKATEGTTVTARILPPGRALVATVLCLSESGVRRHEIEAKKSD
ncbi:hypothetical protein IEU95_11915 [Hoyosella rhizosphaerae]|uniref:Uncharacterized protein n=1 Tax=Hoyosella rhizosphaerae TaxID=1755582 RepID=A0A916XDF5_9ACTN|nr:hypothetical protein [Hoyosella rhizosphaerae]MBN4927539.1 hypothetical protein [Hoyosella rhizosphaerae]GGC63695.1 hypothetical protein GCM10011410_15160 [Hoyosella rhizosphaerae]